jgi:GH15 family glucan-1,4-alpha-glucosidase
VALVALDGAIDWLCVPRVDSPPAFAALLDPERGGRFALSPTAPFGAVRRYLPDTNVLETTFETADGSVRVTDALAWAAPDDGAAGEVLRRIEGLAGEVALRWSVEPRCGWDPAPAEVAGTPAQALLHCGEGPVLGLEAWDAGAVERGPSTVAGELVCRAGDRALLVLRAAGGGAPRPTERDAAEARLDATAQRWRAWAATGRYDGPWAEPVRRGALALALLVDEATGAAVAAPTTSLPERLGGPRNYDYRLAWLRDANLTVDALQRLGYEAEADASLEWLLRTAGRTHPRLWPVYTLDGEPAPAGCAVDMRGYRDSTPVRHGNDAADQLQLGVYGDVLEIAWMHVQAGHPPDEDAAARLAECADILAARWTEPDSGLWELHEPGQFTQSKMACVVALDCASRMARAGAIPDGAVARWEAERERARAFVHERCWSEARRAYVRAPGSEELDAGVLLTARVGVPEPDERMAATVAALRAELGRGPLLYRFTGAIEREGAFLPCSFWLAEALATAGRAEEAAALLDELTALANDVGLYAEEVDRSDGAFLGNFPQALSHLGLITAACAIG